MDDLQTRIAQLEDEAADCELMACLSIDSKVRDANSKRTGELQEQARALREADPARLTAQG
jgi:hypothetical protein